MPHETPEQYRNRFEAETARRRKRADSVPRVPPDPPKPEALLEDYKLKVGFAVEQINRAQTQFQVMLTLESGIATALIVSNTGSLTKGARWIALLEFVLSLAWVAVGYYGRVRAKAHRADADAAGRAWAAAAGLGPSYRTVGMGPKVQRVGVLAPVALAFGWGLLMIALFTFLR